MICGERRGRRGQSGMCQNMTHSIFFEHFSDWTGFECCLGTGGGRYAKNKNHIHNSEHIPQHTKHTVLCSCQIRLSCDDL